MHQLLAAVSTILYMVDCSWWLLQRIIVKQKLARPKHKKPRANNQLNTNQRSLKTGCSLHSSRKAAAKDATT